MDKYMKEINKMDDLIKLCDKLENCSKKEICYKNEIVCTKAVLQSYINEGDKKVNVRIVHAAKLDHFYPKSLYPFFALSLYNLIPVCGTCNLVKSDNKKIFASPFIVTSIYFYEIISRIQ